MRRVDTAPGVDRALVPQLSVVALNHDQNRGFMTYFRLMHVFCTAFSIQIASKTIAPLFSLCFRQVSSRIKFLFYNYIRFNVRITQTCVAGTSLC